MNFNKEYYMDQTIKDVFSMIQSETHDSIPVFVPYTKYYSNFHRTNFYAKDQNRFRFFIGDPSCDVNGFSSHDYERFQIDTICRGDSHFDATKITEHSFPVAYAYPFFDPQLTSGLFDVQDPFVIPDFEKELRNKMQFERINDDLSFDLIEETPDEKEKREEAFEQKLRVSIERKKREYLSVLRQQEMKWQSKRRDLRMLSLCSRTLKPGGLLIFWTIKEFMDERFSFILARDYEFFKIARPNDDAKDEINRIVIFARRNQFDLNKNRFQIDYEKVERIKQFRYQYSYDEITPLSQIEKRLYTVPKTMRNEIKDFRIGPITAEELARYSAKTTVFEKFFDVIQSKSMNEKPKPPMPLSSGIVSLCLASGLTNGYLGTGPDAHLVKGSVYKKRGQAQTEEDPKTGNIISKENEYFHHTIKFIDRNGDIHQLL